MQEIDGKWRKYNPYNPYVEESEGKAKPDLKVESLDDLFEDDIGEDKSKDNIKQETKAVPRKPSTIEFEAFDNIKPTNTASTTSSKTTNFEAPVLPQEDTDEIFSIDVQKELEAKFDELFGPIDDE